MTHPLTKGLTGAVVAAALLPASALAEGGPDHGASGATARVRTSVHRVHRVLDRAIEAADDSDDAVAIARLGKVDTRLAKALKAAQRAADGTKGPASLGLVAAAADEVATETGAALDDASQELSDALVSSLDGALDDRDTIVPLVDDSRALSRIADASGDEADAFTEGVEDDTLVDSAKTALTDAAAQATATQTAATTAAGTDDDADEDSPSQGGGPGHGDCPDHGSQEGPGRRA